MEVTTGKHAPFSPQGLLVHGSDNWHLDPTNPELQTQTGKLFCISQFPLGLQFMSEQPF